MCGIKSIMGEIHNPPILYSDLGIIHYRWEEVNVEDQQVEEEVNEEDQQVEGMMTKEASCSSEDDLTHEIGAFCGGGITSISNNAVDSEDEQKSKKISAKVLQLNENIAKEDLDKQVNHNKKAARKKAQKKVESDSEQKFHVASCGVMSTKICKTLLASSW